MESLNSISAFSQAFPLALSSFLKPAQFSSSFLKPSPFLSSFLKFLKPSLAFSSLRHSYRVFSSLRNSYQVFASLRNSYQVFLKFSEAFTSLRHSSRVFSSSRKLCTGAVEYTKPACHDGRGFCELLRMFGAIWRDESLMRGFAACFFLRMLL